VGSDGGCDDDVLGPEARRVTVGLRWRTSGG
jgi:hypothetical protein